MLDLGKGQIVLVLVSMDLRAGYYRLAESNHPITPHDPQIVIF